MRSLDVLFKDLDFAGGALLTATDDPSLCRNSHDWLEKGEWLAAGKRAGVEKIFFVENNPVAVFAECGSDTVEKVKAFNRAWSLARPRLLFLASPGEITVYDLAQKPVDENKHDEWKNLKTLEVLHDIGKVSKSLQQFHRDNIESGRIFGDSRFGDLKNRADKALIRDLKTVRRELFNAGLSDDKARFAHALIGRSIFIRYLEDRKVLTEEYFLKIARQKSGRTDLLRNPVSRAGFDFSNHQTFYPRILADKEFTYALFRSLGHDFNGDMFPEVDEEEQGITQDHLRLIQNLLYGDIETQKKLFFYAYRFDIVPLDLISSIYEEFYHPSTKEDEKKNKARQDGAYYTPPVLAEFVLSRVLTADVIRKTPRVLDPACGSGIFLVEAFRRIVRYEWHKKGKPLVFDELKQILKNQLAGIEINEEAAKITAFSLYLSMLHYLDPPAIDRQIKQGNKLPHLLATDSRSKNHYHCILVGNAFDTDHIDSNALLRKRFGNKCADVIIGNPPWGTPGNKADAEAKARQKVMLNWCSANNKPIGDKESSQAFLWRALDFLKKGGKAGMLVSSGVLFKHSTTTQSFRKQWFDCVKVNEVFNFTHVRSFFFKGVSSPFISITFCKEKQANYPVLYWSAKKSHYVCKAQSVLLSKNDMKLIRNCCLSDYRVWKLYDYANHSDKEFIDFLQVLPGVTLLEDQILFSCVGFKKANQKKDAGWLTNFKKIKKEAFCRYSELNDESFEEVPRRVEHHGRGKEIYEGTRIVIKEGLRQANRLHGRIEARYETEPYAYNHSFHVVRLINEQEWRYKILLGVLWSSFARYYLFLTSANWGIWHDKVLINERLQLPLIFDKSRSDTPKIISIVDKLRDYQPRKRDVFHSDGIPEVEIAAQRRKWEAELDEAVYELYGLSEEQKDLIRDCCEVTLPFFYKPFDSVGAMLAVQKDDLSWIEKYVHIFCRRWNAYLSDGEKMRAKVHLGAHDNMVAVEFFPADKNDSWNLNSKNDSWSYILEQLGNTLPQPMGTSQILLDGLVHVVSENGIIIIKRNEKRFWTRSLAREDADATICKAMQTHLNGESD